MSFSRYSQTPPYHCRFANERIIVPYAGYFAALALNGCFARPTTTMTPLSYASPPPISDICEPYAGLNLGAASIQFDAGCVSDSKGIEQQWQGNPATVEVFLCEFRRKSSMSAIGFWKQMRPGVVSQAFDSLSSSTLNHWYSNVIDAFLKEDCAKAKQRLLHAFNAPIVDVLVLRTKGAFV